ncbi:MAG: hypothetical protein IPJ90_09400 [Anaerolineaceae bacterium]|nr:hypothetical protein [Anaerolineaceae bacterium]
MAQNLAKRAKCKRKTAVSQSTTFSAWANNHCASSGMFSLSRAATRTGLVSVKKKRQASQTCRSESSFFYGLPEKVFVFVMVPNPEPGDGVSLQNA